MLFFLQTQFWRSTLKIVLVAYEFGMSEILSRVAGALRRYSRDAVSTTEFLRFGQGDRHDHKGLEEAVRDADIVLATFANVGEEHISLVACEFAVKYEKKLALYAGAFDGYENKLFASFREYTSLLIRATGERPEHAERFYPNATVAVIRSPLWDDWDDIPQSREEIRESFELVETDNLFLLALDKWPGDNFYHMGMILEALQALRNCGVALAISCHPGDPLFQENGNHFYLDFASRFNVRCFGNHNLITSQLIPAADAVIVTLSEIGFQAAYHGKVVMNLLTAPVLNMRKAEGHQPNWYVCDVAEAALAVRDMKELQTALWDIRFPSLHKDILENAARTFPRPDSESASGAKEIAKQLEQLAAS